MKKIALAIENFNRYGGGAESYAVSLAESLLQAGWQVHCYGVKWGNDPAQAMFHHISVPRFLPTWLKMLFFAFKHKKMVQKERFDVVLGFGNTIFMNAYQSHGGVHWYSTLRKSYTEPNQFLRFLKKILIFLSPKHHVRNWIESAPFRAPNLPSIVAISEMIKEDMVNYYKINPQDITLIYNGIDTEKFKKKELVQMRGPVRERLGIKDEDVVFLFVSFELKKKGIEPLVKAAALLKRQSNVNFRVLIVGGNPYGNLKKIIKNLDLGETVIFTGACKKVVEFYSAADIFLLPSYYDACSLVVLEAMLCGLPPITTKTNGISGILTDGENGYVISHPPKAEELSEKMELLLDQERRNNMAEAAFCLGKQYTKKRNHSEMLKIMNEVCSNKS